MTTLRFPSDAVWSAVWSARALPDEVTRAPARFMRRDGVLWVAPSVEVPADVRAALAARGVDEEAVGELSGQVSCWPEILPAVRAPEPESTSDVLFAMPAGQLLAAAGEMLRLGCDRQRWCVREERAWILAKDPPWYSVLRALDPAIATAAFVPAAPGVWVEVGFAHPLAAGVHPAAGHLALIRGSGPWEQIPDGPWTPIYDRLDVVLAAEPVAWIPVDLPPRLTVPLRLVDSGRSAPASLWIVRDEAIRRLDALLGSLPDDVVQRLAFAVVACEPPVVVLRARPSASGPPAIEVRGERYTPHLEMPNLYLPDDATLEPPLRRDRVREVLAPEPFEVAWLHRTGPTFRVERLPERVFRPLAGWVDYVADRDAAALGAWVDAATFAFDDWVDVGVEWAEMPVAPRRERRTLAVEAMEPVEDEPTAEEVPAARVAVRPRRLVLAAPGEVDAVAVALGEVQRRFLALDASLDDPARLPLWQEIAGLSRKLGKDREASLAWSHALWMVDGAAQQALASAWASEELGALGLSVDQAVDRLARAPTQPVLQAVAACLAAGAVRPSSALAAALERGEADLDVRSAWLAQRALAADDPLALARARDRLIARLRPGLSVGRDLPGFLRQLDAEVVDVLSGHLRAQREHFARTPRNRHPVESDPARTAVYLDRVFAWGFATLGDAATAGALTRTDGPIDRSNPVHAALLGAYDARIAQALQGVSRDVPLPPATAARFEGLAALESYAVNRVRKASGILESQELLDPFKAFDLGYADSLGPGFEGLRGISDPAELASRLGNLLADLQAHGEPVRVIDGVSGFLPLLPAADAVPLLERAMTGLAELPVAGRARVLASLMLVAGQLQRVDLVRDLTRWLDDALQELPVEHLATQADGLVKGLRSLRRVGLTEEAGALLDGVISRATGRDLESVVTRVVAAGGLFALGREAHALPWIDAGLLELDREFKKPVGRLRLARALGVALASAPRAISLDRLPRLASHLPVITDSYSTNAYFCESVIDFAESVVLGHVDGNLAQGARHWLDEGEYLVRRRIHLG